jgi:hypothetical protein
MAISRARRYAASAALFVAAGGLAWTQVHFGFDWIVAAMTAGVIAAGAAISRPSLHAQIFARATAWCAFLPMLVVAAVQMFFREPPDRFVWLFGVTSGLALLLSRPMLHTDHAKATFSPVRFRRTFLAGATASTSTGLMTGVIACADIHNGHVGAGLALGTLAASLLGSAFGILRMRGWSVLLATATSALTLIVAALMHDAAGLALATTAIPGMLLGLPIVASRLGLGESSAPARVRVEEPEPEITRVRIADSPVEIEDPIEQPRARAQVG